MAAKGTGHGRVTGGKPEWNPSDAEKALFEQMTPTALATARTGLLPMYASPWAALYGGPSDPSFAQLWGQDPSQGTAPPPGTPAYIGQGGGANQPPSNPNPPPPDTTPPPTTTPPPITNVPGVPGTTYPGPDGTPGTQVFGGNHTGGLKLLIAYEPKATYRRRFPFGAIDDHFARHEKEPT